MEQNPPENLAFEINEMFFGLAKKRRAFRVQVIEHFKVGLVLPRKSGQLLTVIS